MYLSNVIIDFQEFLKLRQTLPVVDVRSENEFHSGNIGGAVNVPLLNNAERVVVGTAYKQRGQLEAIKEGFRLVGPRLHDIVEESMRIGSELIVHCWRGGMRSSNYCRFVEMAGVKTYQLKGGYKTYRTQALASFQKHYRFNVISGYTGSGKSELLRELRNQSQQVIDLEALASHKGSAFGGLGQKSQPTTEQFQNNLFEELLKLDIDKPVWIEDESIAIGRIFLPADFWKTMSESPIYFIDVPRDVRLTRLMNEYGNADVDEFANALKSILKRLGGQHYNAARDFLLSGRMKDAIDVILHYYDKTYAYGIERKQNRIHLRCTWDGNDITSLAKHLSTTNRTATTTPILDSKI